MFQNGFAQSVEFTSLQSRATWVLSNIYAPCTDEGKRDFIDWFKNIDMPDDIDWLVVGDFNLIRKIEARKKPGANANEIFLFNDAISALELVEIPLQGRKYTWSNNQESPLLERLDWVFSSLSWTSNYPKSLTTWLHPWQCNLLTMLPVW